jgi:hypothetical protein
VEVVSQGLRQLPVALEEFMAVVVVVAVVLMVALEVVEQVPQA